MDSVPDGAAAWNAFQTESYDLLVTDNHMPHLNGIQLIRRLHESGLVLPIILASGSLPVREHHHHAWFRIHAMLLKPFTCGQLTSEVSRVLSAGTDSLWNPEHAGSSGR